MAFSEKSYFEKIGELQQNLHEIEKRRFELERELLAFRRSEKRLSQIRNGKLRCYLKEIYEREKRAKTRNLELRKDMEQIELHMKELRNSHCALHQKKEKVLQGSAQKNSSFPLTAGLYQPAAIFMGRQTANVSSAEPRAAGPGFAQPSAAKPSHFSTALEQSDGGVMGSSRVVRKDTEDVLDFSTGQSESERNGGVTGGAPPAPNLTAMATRPGAESFSSLATSLRRKMAKSPPAERGPEGLSIHRVAGDGDRVLQRSSPELHPGKERQGAESSSILSSSVEIDPSVNTESELSLSLSDDEDLGPSPEDLVHPDARTKRTSTPRSLANNTGASTRTGQCDTSAREGSKSTEGSEVGEESRQGVEPLPSKQAPVGLSLEGFSHLLESIEERLSKSARKLYGISSISEHHLSHLISLCDRKAGLNDENLEACGAAVLHQLQRLSWSTSKGCLLPREIVSANRTTTEECKIRSSLPPDGAQLWDCWFRHALNLQERGGFTADRIAEVFVPSLVEKNASYLDEAKVLLRTLLGSVSGGIASAESDESSSDPPSPLNDGGQMKAARPARWLDTATSAIQGLQSGEEDSEEESFVESIPIRETKAYQLLKQSAAQQRRASSQEEDGLDLLPLGVMPDRHVEHSGKGDLSEASSSLSQEGPRGRGGTTTKKTVPAIQSKAFWGESDDSNTDIEAALRPKSHSTTNDDFDDFYD